MTNIMSECCLLVYLILVMKDVDGCRIIAFSHLYILLYVDNCVNIAEEVDSNCKCLIMLFTNLSSFHVE